MCTPSGGEYAACTGCQALDGAGLGRTEHNDRRHKSLLSSGRAKQAQHVYTAHELCVKDGLLERGTHGDFYTVYEMYN
jgi:hypothetical protein